MNEQNETLDGVWAPSLTALHPDLAIDHRRTAAHVRTLLDQGCHGVVVFGTTGEANSFSVTERQVLLEQLLATGVEPDRLMVGTGCCALTDTVTLSRHALDCGCRRVLVLPPFYYKNPSDEALITTYSEILERVSSAQLRLLFYHFPRLSTVPVTLPVIEQMLARYPENIAGIKDSSGDWSGTRSLLERFPTLAVFPGTERLLLDTLRLGGAGTITATANVNATAIRRLYDTWQDNSSQADVDQAALNEYRGVFEQFATVSALKCWLAHLTGESEWLRVRPPLEPLSPAQAERLIALATATMAPAVAA